MASLVSTVKTSEVHRAGEASSKDESESNDYGNGAGRTTRRRRTGCEVEHYSTQTKLIAVVEVDWCRDAMTVNEGPVGGAAVCQADAVVATHQRRMTPRDGRIPNYKIVAGGAPDGHLIS